MKPGASAGPATIDEYIASYPPVVRDILERVRQTIRKAAPDAVERIAYRMPSFEQQGALVYFGGFKKHIGLFPPVGDAALAQEASPYAGPKGNLQFPLDKPIPYTLIAKIVKARVRDNALRAEAKHTTKKTVKKAVKKAVKRTAR